MSAAPGTVMARPEEPYLNISFSIQGRQLPADHSAIC